MEQISLQVERTHLKKQSLNVLQILRFFLRILSFSTSIIGSLLRLTLFVKYGLQ